MPDDGIFSGIGRAISDYAHRKTTDARSMMQEDMVRTNWRRQNREGDERARQWAQSKIRQGRNYPNLVGRSLYPSLRRNSRKGNR